MAETAWRTMTWQDEERLVRQIAHVLSRGRRATKADHRDAVAVLKKIDTERWVLVRRTTEGRDDG